MKILFEHANSFAYNEYGCSSTHSYSNCLIARVCFEYDDSGKIGLAVDEISKVFRNLKPDTLIIFPFSHLSNRLMPQENARICYSKLNEKLAGIRSILLPFGISKGYKIDIKDHRLNNIFRSI